MKIAATKMLMKIFPLLLTCTLLSCDLLLQAGQSIGYVVAWGYQPTNTNSIGFTNCIKISGEVVSNAIAISRSDAVGLALKADGTVVGWGGNYRGQSVGYTTPHTLVTNGIVKIDGEILSNIVSIAAASEFGIALKKNGTVSTWGDNYVPKSLSNIVSIAATDSHSWGLRPDGTVIGWYRESSPTYELLNLDSLSNVVAIAAGTSPQGTRGVAIKKDGTVAHWGSETIYQDATPPAGLSNVIAVAAGFNHSLALVSDGKVVGWGFNYNGQATGIPTPSTLNRASVSSGFVNLGGQVLSNVVAIAAGREISMALKNDGTVVVWGFTLPKDVFPPTVPDGLSNVVAIAMADHSFLAITTNAAVAHRFRR